MRITILTLFALIAAHLAGCAAHPEPIIDLKGVDQAQFVEDWNQCESYSNEVQVAKGTAKGTAVGAVIGAIAGAIGGNSTTTGIGAAHGGLQGGTASGFEASEEKKRVFKNCMSGRGYVVLN